MNVILPGEPKFVKQRVGSSVTAPRDGGHKTDLAKDFHRQTTQSHA